MVEPPATTSSATAAPDVLLATKLHVPRPRPGFVARPRLTDRLTQAHGGELVLVCAPAGFGKTALLADWTRGGQPPVAWLTLDEADNDPARFWRHAAAALDGVRPGVAERVAVLLRGLQPALFEAVVTTLVNEFAGVVEEVTLVLDDYRWGGIARGAAGQPSLRQAARHLAYAGGWKRLEPMWDLIVRARRVNAMLPLLEATLDAFGGARRPGAVTGADRVTLARLPRPRHHGDRPNPVEPT